MLSSERFRVEAEERFFGFLGCKSIVMLCPQQITIVSGALGMISSNVTPEQQGREKVAQTPA